MNTIQLEIAGKTLVIHPLSSSRVVAVARIVAIGTRVWAINAEGRIYFNNFSSLRGRRRRPAPSTVAQLRTEDIDALGWLGLIDKVEALALREAALFRRDFDRRIESLTDTADDFVQIGVRLPANWKKLAIANAEKSAALHQKRRRAEAAAAKGKRSCQ